jgi:tRNA(Ile)-lysidine synthase
MNTIAASFETFVKTHHLFQKSDALLIAVSGGVDSVVLCELCSDAGYQFSIAHCNFQLRGEESDGDEKFVKDLAAKYGVDFYHKKFDTKQYAADHKMSIQVAARELRYAWFSEMMKEIPQAPRYLLTAHHADDNIETITMNFFKGTGINGLKGIVPAKNKLVRPLLFATKDAIVDFAKERQLSYREDSSNSSDHYTRNYFRNQVLPAIEKVYPQVKENLLQNAQRFAEINTIYQSAINQMKQKLVYRKGKEFHIPVLKLQQSPGLFTVVYEIIKDFGFSADQSGEVVKLMDASSGKFIDSATHRMLRNRKWLIVLPLTQGSVNHYLISEETATIDFEGGTLSVEKNEQPVPISKDPLLAQLDARAIKFPLLLRRWKTGDYFYPLGMPKKKKISRFLIDLKMPLHQKQQVWVLESDKKILWVLGHRIDDRFKVTGAAKETLSLRLVPPAPAN